MGRSATWPDVERFGAWTSAVLDWVDPQYGPVTELHGLRLVEPEPAYWLFGAELARAPVGTWFSGAAPTGAAGTSIEPDEALIRCLGEIAERYSAMNASVTGELRRVDPELMALLPGAHPTSTAHRRFVVRCPIPL